MDRRITVVGIGPGHPDYLLPVAAAAIRSARVLAGSRRALESFSDVRQETKVVDGNVAAFTDWVREILRRDDITVMVSGDPGYFSLLDALCREFPGHTIEVVPGLSSFQVAFARIGLPWHEATLFSFHGREPAEKQLGYQCGRILSFLTDSTNHPAVIADKLLNKGWPASTEVWLCRDLSYGTEKIVYLNLSAIASILGFESCVMVVKG